MLPLLHLNFPSLLSTQPSNPGGMDSPGHMEAMEAMEATEAMEVTPATIMVSIPAMDLTLIFQDFRFPKLHPRRMFEIFQ